MSHLIERLSEITVITIKQHYDEAHYLIRVTSIILE